MAYQMIDIAGDANSGPIDLMSAMAQILNLNNQAVPHVNELSLESLSGLRDQCCQFLVALPSDAADSVAGFLILMDENSSYRSPNYQYFAKNYDSFVYVDRIVVSEEFRGGGLGSTFYQSVIEDHTGQKQVLCCEVNSRPPNPQSLKFHHQIGFETVARQETEGGTKEVQLMTRRLED